LKAKGLLQSYLSTIEYDRKYKKLESKSEELVGEVKEIYSKYEDNPDKLHNIFIEKRFDLDLDQKEISQKILWGIASLLMGIQDDYSKDCPGY